MADQLCCAECGTTEARTYVVTLTGGDDDREGRTEVCRECDDIIRAADQEAS